MVTNSIGVFDSDSNPSCASTSKGRLSNEIHLWLSYYEDVSRYGLQQLCRGMLCEEEKKKEETFYFMRDRLRYLTTRAVVRTVLSKYAPISPKEWRFSFNAYGRPAIANVTIAASGLTFNVSHTKDLILLAITENRHLGVDVENAIARAEVLDLARRYFAPEETAALLGLPQELVQRAFLDIWTLKESYVKARGLGLSIPLDEFFFRKGQTGDITFHIGSRLSDHALHWQFWQFQPKSPHIIAVCAENREIVTSFVVRTIIPGFFDEPLNIQPIGASTYRQKPDTRSECGSCQRGSGG